MTTMNDTVPATRRRFIFTSYVAIDAATIEDARALIEDNWAFDGWREFADHVRVFAPDGEPDDIQEPDDGPACVCPPDLLARGGFTGSCPAH